MYNGQQPYSSAYGGDGAILDDDAAAINAATAESIQTEIARLSQHLHATQRSAPPSRHYPDYTGGSTLISNTTGIEFEFAEQPY